MAEQNFLVPQEQYLKAGIHIGTKFRTKYMEPFIYKTRPDGLSVLNIQKIDERLKILAQFIARFDPQDILVVSRRENAWKAAKKLGEMTDIRVIAGRYPPGILTNPQLINYTETKVILATDAWPDRNAIKDANISGVPVIALCDTNNQTNNIDLVVPCNNKGKKSLGLLFYIMAREYLKLRGKILKDAEFTATVEDFTDE